MKVNSKIFKEGINEWKFYSVAGTIFIAIGRRISGANKELDIPI
jgi:hypothetical protein